MKSEHSPAAALLTEFIHELFITHGHYIAIGDALIQDIGLTSALWQVLHAVHREPLPVAQIARNMGITRQSVLRTVNTLKRRGFIELLDNPNHQRAKLVALLGEGEKRLDIAIARQITLANEQATHVDMQHMQATVDFMRTLRGDTREQPIPL